MKECIFCINQEKLLQNDYFYVRYDKYPLSLGHSLIIPKRHISRYIELNENEKLSMHRILDDCTIYLEKKYSPDGFNIGINDGVTAGQTIMHLHIHVIPRYKGDAEDPRGEFHP